jgi:sulfur transfer complex TusBCD TusB component (DsrH family)
MAAYLFIESLDPFESNDSARYWEMATGLARQGDQVTVLLIQNGVLAARAGARADGLTSLSSAGVEVLAEDFSLRERGIGVDRLATGVRAAPLDVVLDHLGAGRRVLWH